MSGRRQDSNEGRKQKIAQSNWNRSSRPREGRGSASSRTNRRLVSAKYLPRVQLLFPVLYLLSKTRAHSPRQAFGNVLLPGAPAAPNDIIRRSFLGPDTATANSQQPL